MNTSLQGALQASGGQLQELVVALIDSAFDKDLGVRDAMESSLCDLGKHEPALILSSCYSYLVKHSKLPVGHRIVILHCMEKIVQATLDRLEIGLVEQLIKQASAEMTNSKEVVAEWQTTASNVLVALGCRFCNEVMSELQEKFQPGVLPHFFVLKTMANLASANVYGMVPFLKVTMGTMLPMLGLAKQDNMRWVFATALSKFCEAILDYVANPEKAPDPSVKKDFFSGEVDAAYDVLFNVWLQSKEAKVRVVIVEALGQMASIMTREKLEEQLPKLLQVMLNLYKKHNEPYHVTLGLCMVLEAASQNGNTCLEPYLDQLLNILFGQTCQSVDYNNPLTIKNHNELLRCFTVLSGPFSGKIVGFLLQKLDGSNEKFKSGSLIVLRHLINSAGTAMDDKKELLISGLKPAFSDNNNKVKKVFAQIVMAMAHHGYLELEGGQAMLEFIVRQCALLPEVQGKRPLDPEYVSNEALRSMCENVLQLLSTTVDNMDVVLWPALLEYIIPDIYTEASGVLCRCVAQIAERKSTTNDFKIVYDDVNVPKPPVLIARLLTLAGRPTNGHQRGAHILAALVQLSAVLDERLTDLWDTVIPKLQKYLEDHCSEDVEWCQKSWEDLLLKFISKTLETIDDEVWISEVGNALESHIPLYAYYPEEKNFLYKFLGAVVRKSNSKEFVNKHITTILNTVKHNSQIEREGCAMAMGLIAASHADSVINRLDSYLRPENRKSGSFFGFIKDSVYKNEMEDKMKATLVLCYGYVSLYAPPSLIVSRVETAIMKSVSSQFPAVKEVVLKQSLIKTVDLIGQAMHPSHLQAQHVFVWRGDLLGHIQNYLKMEPATHIKSDTRALALKAAATLAKLDPAFTELEAFEILKVALDCYIPLPDEGTAGNKQKEETYEELLEHDRYLKITEKSLTELLHEMLLKTKNPEGLETIFKMLSHWLVSLLVHERQRAMKLLLGVVELYYQNISFSVANNRQLWNLGLMLARLVPRCTDPDLKVRQQALDCIQVVLRMNLRYQGHPEEYKDQKIEALTSLKEKVSKSEPSLLFTAISDLSKVMSSALPSDQLESFVGKLYDGLRDPHEPSASGSCVVLNSVIKSRGNELHLLAEQMMLTLHGRIGEISYSQTRTGTLRCIRTLAGHHLITVIKALLEFPLPFDQTVRDCWGILAGDGAILGSVLDHLIEVLDKSLPYEEVRDNISRNQKTMRVATRLPVAATAALCELFQKEEAESMVVEKFHRLLATMMLRVASSVGVKPPKKQDDKNGKGDTNVKRSIISSNVPKDAELNAGSMSITCFQEFLKCAKSEELLERLHSEEVFETMQNEEEFKEAFTVLSRLVVEIHPEYIHRLITILNPTLAGVYEPQRIMVAAFFAEIINQRCGGDLTILEALVNGLLGRLIDPSPVVRMLCLRGLGNIASCGSDQVGHYATTVLSAMMAGMDDKEDLNDDITLEAMSGLSKVLAAIDEQSVRAILINISLRIRPCFEKERPTVRAASITLFGNLAAFGDGSSKAPFLEQVHTNLVSLLLHLNDPDQEVKQACKFALRKLGPIMESESVNSMFQKHLIEDGTLHYGEFMNDLSKTIIQSFPEKINFYVMGNIQFFKSSWPAIKGNAAMFNGFLLGNLDTRRYDSISREHVCGSLILLLKDSSPEVRIKAAEAISQLHHM